MSNGNGTQGLVRIDQSNSSGAPLALGDQWSDERIELIKRTVAKGATTDELALFIAVCKHTGLDPFAKQIYCIKRRDTAVIQIGIDGYRLVADRTGKYGGQIGPMWADAEGEWHDVWLNDQPPAAARVGIVRKDWQQPIWAVARFKSYVQDSPLWRQMPDQMLAKAAEMLAFRKAFPMELAGTQPLPPELDIDDRPAYVDADGVIDEVHPARALEPGQRSAKAQAVIDEMDAAIAEAEASVRLDGDTQVLEDQSATPFEQEQPPSGPRWAGTPLGRQVSALVDALTEAGKRFSLPDDDAGEAELKGWLASKKTALAQRS